MAARASSAVELHRTPQGGHVGFVEGRSPRNPVFWAEERALEWLAPRLDRP